jgi:hypothetical protein
VADFLVEPRNQQLRFGDLGLKIIVTVSCFEPQNQAGYCLSIMPQNRWKDDGVTHASRSSGLLHVEVSWVKVSQSGLKTGRCAMVGGACGTITGVASSPS